LFHKLFLRFSEMLAIRFSDIVIADSISIRNFLAYKYSSSIEKIKVIEYGSAINQKYESRHLESYKLTFKNYYLVVCRLEPENNLIMIIEGFIKSGSRLPLVIIGNVSSTRYVKRLINNYSSDRVIFPGGIYDRTVLNSLRYGCRAYLHGHTVGGTNPSLLEALGNGNIIICHDNIFNREVTDSDQFYFTNADDCSGAIQRVEKLGESEIEVYREKAYCRIREYYNWDNILGKYIQLFTSLGPFTGT
jgi:glycosyltransferase involved in cell wall biosynthesis